MHRVPFCEVVEDLRRRRNEGLEALQRQIDTASQREQQLQAMLEGEKKMAASLVDASAALERQVMVLQQENASLTTDLHAARAHAQRIGAEATTEQQRAQATIESLRNSLATAQNSIVDLKPFHTAFLSAQHAFDTIGG